MKAVNKSVSKGWALGTTQILTRSSPDITTMFTWLLTFALEEKQRLKSDAARQRVDDAVQACNQGLKYGWQFGISERRVLERSLKVNARCRRLRFVISRAIQAGERIGREQLARMQRHQPTASLKPLRALMDRSDAEVIASRRSRPQHN